MTIETRDADTPVQLTARILADGDHFVASVEGLELAGNGSTPEAAENALIQGVRSWLERQDTAGRLAEALGIDELDETTEIVLQFIPGDADGSEASPDS